MMVSCKVALLSVNEAHCYSRLPFVSFGTTDGPGKGILLVPYRSPKSIPLNRKIFLLPGINSEIRLGNKLDRKRIAEDVKQG